ncbi:MAG: hypothetical protein H6955_21845 [Chromatiaceae bacterium]|nr:hypothetical protein [Chromatiaceae bacterium]
MHPTMFRPLTRLFSDRPLRKLRSALSALPNNLLEPLRLQVVDGYSMREIADHLGISIEQATYRVRRARCTVYGVVAN